MKVHVTPETAIKLNDLAASTSGHAKAIDGEEALTRLRATKHRPL